MSFADPGLALPGTHGFTVEKGKIALVDEILDTAPILAGPQP